ncbi:MAG: RluA family pseudouridine synthase [Bacilli bacterium]|nr:RluA family pseudouridine synthase [Bacilli bacterium]
MESGKMMKIKVLFEDNHIIVVEKEINIPVQADDSKDLDMLTIIKEYLKNKYNKPGNVYLGLVHRLDRPVGGVMVFAKTSKAAARLSEIIRTNNFKKTYLALVHGKLEKDKATLINYIYKDEETFTSKIVEQNYKGSKEAILDYKVVKYNNKLNMSLLEINLHTGRHHQIRVQLSNINHPIYGDQRYGKDLVGIQIHLWASKIEFKHPVKDEFISFESIPSWAKEYLNGSEAIEK